MMLRFTYLHGLNLILLLAQTSSERLLHNVHKLLLMIMMLLGAREPLGRPTDECPRRAEAQLLDGRARKEREIRDQHQKQLQTRRAKSHDSELSFGGHNFAWIIFERKYSARNKRVRLVRVSWRLFQTLRFELYSLGADVVATQIICPLDPANVEGE